MNAALTILVAAGSALAVTAGASLLGSGRAEAREPDADLSALVSELSQRVEGLRAEQAKVAGQLAELRLQPASGGERYAEGEIESAIERYLAAHPVAAPTAAPAVAALDQSDVEKVDLHTLVGALTDDDSEWLEREELWQKVREAGRLDEVLAEFERLAESDPNNPDRKVQLGMAYIEKLQEEGGMLAGKWATKADQEFDKALALDETHWEARFCKAISLSHWPAFTGKTAEATAQFEKLIEIQSKEPVDPKFVSSYLMLGNIYLGQGKNDLALATWNKGLALFPDSAELQAQIDALAFEK
jgi:tetratricopeptide (TPR) repeat protein